jgi:hypothetical protein
MDAQLTCTHAWTSTTAKFAPPNVFENVGDVGLQQKRSWSVRTALARYVMRPDLPHHTV